MSNNELTRADAKALWHAVDAYAWSVRAMPHAEGIKPETIKQERAHLALAKVALRKVQALARESKQRAKIDTSNKRVEG